MSISRGERLRQTMRIHSRVGLMLVIGLLAQAAIIAAFTSAMSTPTLSHAEVGIVASGRVDAHVLSGTNDTIDFRPIADPAAARATVRAGDLPAAIVLAGSHATLVVATASGATLVSSIEQAIVPTLKGSGVSTTIDDVRPLPTSDPHGLATFLLVIGWAIGGYLGVVLLSRVRRNAFQSVRSMIGTFGWLAAYAITSAGAGVLLSSTILGVLAGNAWILLLMGSLISFAISAFTAALLATFGNFGIVLAIVCLVILGNPTSGGSIPDQMLAGGWQVLADILPTNAAVRAVRAVSYFGGSGLGQPALVLSLYAGISLVVTFLVGHLRPRIIAKHIAAAVSVSPKQESSMPEPRPAHAHVRNHQPVDAAPNELPDEASAPAQLRLGAGTAT